MQNTERVPLKQAARELGLSPQGLREHMKRGLLDVGIVIPASKKGGKFNSYLIFRHKLDKVLGKEGGDLT